MSELFVRRSAVAGERGTGVRVLLASVLRRRALVWEMSRRELADMHAGQVAGVIWLVVHPLLLFVVYAFLFSVVFSVRIGDRGPADYLIYLFSGLAPWLLTQEVMSRASNAILGSSTIVKKVSFPPEVLVAKTVLSSLVVQCALFGCVLVYIAFFRNNFIFIIAFLPVVFLMHVILLWGMSLLIAAIVPYFKDVKEIVRVFLSINIYLMPVVYAPGMVPDSLRFVLSLNPFSYLIWCYQDVLYSNAIDHPIAWVILALFSVVTMAAGSYVFVRLRHHFSSVL
jgi:lipopolysaccharide transport system permease protein